MVTIPLTWFGYHIYWDAEKVKQGFVKGAFFARIPIDKPKTFRHLHFATFRAPACIAKACIQSAQTVESPFRVTCDFVDDFLGRSPHNFAPVSLTVFYLKQQFLMRLSKRCCSANCLHLRPFTGKSPCSLKVKTTAKCSHANA